MLRAQLELGNHWNEIAKRLRGRGENAVKNRFHILLKKYRDETCAVPNASLDAALHAVTDKDKDDKAWVHAVIQEKTVRLSHHSHQPPADSGNPLEETKVPLSAPPQQTPVQVSMSASGQEEAAVRQGYVMDAEMECITSRTQQIQLANAGLAQPSGATDRKSERVEEGPERLVVQSAEDVEELLAHCSIFRNRETLQELYLSPFGVFIKTPSQGIDNKG
jgi:hypothetical protein